MFDFGLIFVAVIRKTRNYTAYSLVRPFTIVKIPISSAEMTNMVIINQHQPVQHFILD